MYRNKQIERALTEDFDIVIIGGGITGAGIFLRAAQRGLRPLLLDKGDFAIGTSSRSSKLIHGGLRYLAYFRIKMVYEGLHEREHLLKMYPHLVRPQAFFMPVYHSWVNRLKFSVGLTGYDMLQGKSLMPKHISIPRDEIKIRFKQIKHDDLKGGFLYYDARTNDARLTNEVIQQGVQLGGVALNYMKVNGFELKENAVAALRCIDTLKGGNYHFSGKVTVSAAGVWTDDLLSKLAPQEKKFMKPSKGIHVITSGDFFPRDTVLILPSEEGDGRFIWCVPWEDNLNVIGTTDTDYEGDIDRLLTTGEEVDYLLKSVNKYLAGAQLTKDDVLSTYAGLRPLLDDYDEENESTSRSRDFEVWWNNDNFVTIAGGKLTSFLSMADDLLEQVKEKKMPEMPDLPAEADREPPRLNVPAFPIYQMLRDIYGDANTLLIKDIIDQDQATGFRIDIKYRYLIAEFIFFIRYQHAVTLDDIFTRRTLISYNMKVWDEPLIQKTLEIFRQELSWSEEECSHQVESYRKSWEEMHTWK
jgi:glycerol-3-phosphate dehydrogenase